MYTYTHTQTTRIHVRISRIFCEFSLETRNGRHTVVDVVAVVVAQEQINYTWKSIYETRVFIVWLGNSCLCTEHILGHHCQKVCTHTQTPMPCPMLSQAKRLLLQILVLVHNWIWSRYPLHNLHFQNKLLAAKFVCILSLYTELYLHVRLLRWWRWWWW